VVEGEAMKKLDARFDALWTRIHDIQISNSYYVNRRELEGIRSQIAELTDVLIEAGILIEPTDIGPKVHQVSGTPYVVRKVK
jgi:hypothetical protein